MMLSLRFAVMAWLGISNVGLASTLNVLMIGNSYTYRNTGGPSDDLQGIFDADPDYSATVVRRVDGGASLWGHRTNPLTTDLITDSVTNQWDVIVLQEQSTRPALAMKNGGGELANLDRGGPWFTDLIRANQPQARVLLYETWARVPDNVDLVDEFDNDPIQMQDFTNLGYDRIEKNLPGWDNTDIVDIAPVGDAWLDWHDTYGYSSASRLLHDSDGSHQNGNGSYLAAAVLFERITGKSVVGNTYAGNYLGGVTGTIGGTSKLTLLQQEASRTNGLLNLDADFNDDGVVDGADFTVWLDSFGQTGFRLPADSSANGVVDLADYHMWVAQFGTQPGSGLPDTVPEPAALWLVLAGWLGGLRIRFRTRGTAR